MPPPNGLVLWFVLVLFWPDVGVIPCARHADAPHWAPWDQPPESAYDEGIDGTLWDRKAIGATSDGHLW